MPHAKHEYHQSLVLQGADKAVVAHAIFPELAQGSLESFADFAGIIELPDSLIQKLEDAPCYRLIQPVKFSLGGWVQLNLPLLA
jgi:hypothetical protein